MIGQYIDFCFCTISTMAAAFRANSVRLTEARRIASATKMQPKNSNNNNNNNNKMMKKHKNQLRLVRAEGQIQTDGVFVDHGVQMYVENYSRIKTAKINVR